MANVNVKFNGKDYLLSCDEDQKESLKNLAKYLDTKFNELKDNLGNIGENKLLLITSIKIIDEFFDLQKKINSSKTDFENLSNKFKELKSLVIEYKDKKDSEIQILKDEINNFKNMVENNKNSYDEILDKTTELIENFIETAETNKNIQ